jgi:hypothetical protein
MKLRLSGLGDSAVGRIERADSESRALEVDYNSKTAKNLLVNLIIVINEFSVAVDTASSQSSP